MANLLDQPRTLTDEFALIPGAFVYFYVSNTVTPAPVYASLTLRQDPDDPTAWVYEFGAEHPNPMRSDAAARLPPLWLNPDTNYRCVITDADGNVVHDINRFSVFPGPANITARDNSGAVLPGAQITVYLSQTTQVDDTYVADELGVFEAIGLNDDSLYRVVLKDQFGQLIYDVDPYLGSGVGMGGMGGCVCPNEAFVYFNDTGVRQRWTNVDDVLWNCGSPGVFEVLFTADTFVNAPIVNATAIFGGAEARRCYCEVEDVTPSHAIIRVYNEDGTATDRGVHVTAWEPENVLSTGS